MSGASDVHLVVLIHGLWGSPAHLFAAKEELESAWARKTGNSEKETEVTGPAEDPTISTTVKSGSSENDSSIHPSGTNGVGKGAEEGSKEDLVVIIAGGMTSQLTYDGIDVCASRVAWEVDQEIEKLEHAGKNVRRFSVTGYSLGGLVARYLIGLMHSRSPSFFEKHTPVTFSTIATPHLGVPKYNTLLSGVLVWLGSKLLSRSGEQLYVADRYSDEDRRPLLEIMADPTLVFVHALEQFERIQIFANGINDHTVPYPSSAIETVDHFAEWEDRDLSVETDERDLIISWSAPLPADMKVKKKKGWGISMGTLPPVLRYRFPFNYIIMLLFPIMLPVVVLLMVSRLALDSSRSKRRLQQLAKTSTSPSEASGSYLPIPDSTGLSIESLRQAIRKVERELESDLIASLDSPSISTNHRSHAPHDLAKTHGQPQDVKTKVIWQDSQLRMALWLNKLPLIKVVSWYPQTTNAHSVSIVRDPQAFPAQNQGRGLLRRWAEGVLA